MTWSPPMTKKDRENLMKHDRTESSVPCTQEMVSHDIASNRSTWPSWLQSGVQSIHHSGARGGHLSTLRGGTSCSEGFVLNLWLLPLFSCGCWFSNQFTFPVYISGKKVLTWNNYNYWINISWISKSIPEMCRLQVQSITWPPYSIVVIVSPQEALMLDVPEAFTAMDTSHTNFISQHHSSWVPCYWLFKLSAKSSSGALQDTVKRSLRY